MMAATVDKAVSHGTPAVSFEFFPPNDDGMEQLLWESIQRLAPRFRLTPAAPGLARQLPITPDRVQSHGLPLGPAL